MNNYIFISESAFGHYNAFFVLAESLQQEYQCECIFLGHKHFKEYVQHNGFSFYEFDLSTLSHDSSITEDLSERINSKVRDTKYKWFSAIIDELGNTLMKLDARKIFVDVYFASFFLNYPALLPQVVIVQTMLSTKRHSNVPPLNSRFIPSNGGISLLYTRILWEKYYLKRFFKKSLDKMVTLYQDLETNNERKLRFTNPGGSELLDRKSCFRHGLLSPILEIIMCPMSFEYPFQKFQGQQIHFPLLVKSNRIDLADQPSFDDHINNLLNIRESDKKNRIIYVSLGTLSGIHNYKAKRLITRLINIAKEKNDWHMVFSFNGLFDYSILERKPMNVHFFEKVPQMKVLKIADLMITHGGLNSIKECIFCSVPMISFPLNSRWDQNGNSSRLSYHGLGMVGSLSDNEKTIMKKISLTLDNWYFKKNLKEMLLKINSESSNDFFRKVLTL